MSKDTYKYFRIEGRELLEGLGQTVLELERGTHRAGVVEQLLRLAHTLKGAARVVQHAEIAKLAHEIEDVLSPHRGADTVPADSLKELAARVEAASHALSELTVPDISSQSAASDLWPAQLSVPNLMNSSPGISVEDRFRIARIDIAELDVLLENTAEANVLIGGLRAGRKDTREARELARALGELLGAVTVERSDLRVRRGRSTTPLARARALVEELSRRLAASERELLSGLDRAEGELGSVRERVEQLRLLPASTMFPILERAARDAAERLGKPISFETSGGEIRIDGHILSALREGLIHAVRNAVDHGIEPEGARTAGNKPPKGRVSIAVVARAGRVAISCSDDGRGIDAEGVRRSAVARGVVSQDVAAALAGEALLHLAFHAGVSTRHDVSDLSGRGVGLDVLRDVAVKLKGETRVESIPGQGTRITIEVPVSLSSRTVLSVQVCGRDISIPFDGVRKTLRVGVEELSRSGDQEIVSCEGKLIPFRPLGPLLGLEDHEAPARKAWSVVVLESRGEQAALGVDRVISTRSMVMKTLPRILGGFELVEGAFFDAEGAPELVLHAPKLVQLVRGSRSELMKPMEQPKLPVLVVDDSLTTRSLEQSILESAGYQVDLASSAEQALSKLAESAYSLLVVDVEMPGMNGFQLLEKTRAEREQRNIPAILVTSLNAPEDFARGAEVGAKAYLVKSEFDQRELLGTIRRLIG